MPAAPALKHFYDKETAPQFDDLITATVETGSVKALVSIGRWSRAYAIHHWLECNTSVGNDGGSEHWQAELSREELIELKEACLQVLLIPQLGPELLPEDTQLVQAEKYGPGYSRELKQTIEIIDNALKCPDSWEFEYSYSF